jgi:uncharacterized damage-inducible protein DinB
MNTSLLQDAFAHHVWATRRVIDACRSLNDVQLGTTVPGTYGSILDTLRHTVQADCGYLFVLTAGEHARLTADAMDLVQLQAETEDNGAAWTKYLNDDLDPAVVLVRQYDDGFQTHAPVSIRLAQALHHGTDHRSQVCTALTTLGVDPPLIDVWDFGLDVGTVTEFPPGS